MGTIIVDESGSPPPPEMSAAQANAQSSATFEFDENGPRLTGIESSAEGLDGIGQSTALDVHDPIEISRILAKLDPELLQEFERIYIDWMEAQVRPLTSLDIEFGPMPTMQKPSPLDPSTPTTRAGKIDKPQTPQAVTSSPKSPRAPEHRAEQVPPDATPQDTNLKSPAELTPRVDQNEHRNLEHRENLRKEIDRVDPKGDRRQNLETRVEQLPEHKRREIENYLRREWIRDEQERQSTVVIGRNGRVWTQGEEERDQAREKFEQGLEQAAIVTSSLGGGLLMSAGAAAGIADPDVLINIGQIGSALENALAGRGGARRATVRVQAMRSKTKHRDGSGKGRGRRGAKPARRGLLPKKNIKLDLGQQKRLGITDWEVMLLERTAEVFREEIAVRKNIKNPMQQSVQAHEATQARIAKEFGDAVIVEPGTGVSGPGHKLGDLQAYRPDGCGLMIELKRTAWVRFDGALVTKPINAKAKGQESQTDAFEVLHHRLDTPTVVLDAQGNLYASTQMYDPKTGGSWAKIGGPQ